MRIRALVSALFLAVSLFSLAGCGDDDNNLIVTAVPAAPTNVVAVSGANQITLTWNAVAGAATYNVYQSTSSGVTPANGQKFTTTNPALTRTGLAESTVYFFVVTAVNSAGESAASSQVSASTTATIPTVPTAPTSLTVTGASKQTTLSWNAVAGATSYNVYRGTATGVTTSNGTKFANVTSPLTQTGLADATTYFYIVTAVNTVGESVPSAEVSATTGAATPAVPAQPTGVVAVGGIGQSTLTWNQVPGATSYNVYRLTTTGVTPATGTKFANATSPFVQINLAPATYFYVVTAVNATGESAPSGQVSVTVTAQPPPPAPTGVAATGGTGQTTLSWNAVTEATSYNVYRSTTTGVTPTNGTKFANATSPLVQTGLAPATYFYIVTAVNAAGESAPSSEVSAIVTTQPPAVPAAPTGLAVVGGTGQATITWNALPGTTYNVYRATSTGVTPANGTKFANVTSPLVQTGLAANTYFYVVTAVNAAGESAPSTEASATVSAPLNGPNLYQANCAGCHGSLPVSTKRMRTAAQIQAAINNNIGGMGFLTTLTPAQVQAIADALNF